MSAAEAVPSVLPEEGLDLAAELERYRIWMIEQALVRTCGNQSEAARLLGYATSQPIWHLLKKRERGGSFRRGRAVTLERKRSTEPELPTEPPAAPPVAAPPAPAPAHPAAERVSLTRVASQIDWDLVATLRAEGRRDSQICLILGKKLGINRFIIEKALHLGEARP